MFIKKKFYNPQDFCACKCNFYGSIEDSSGVPEVGGGGLSFLNN
jgi:hypothetical protein